LRESYKIVRSRLLQNEILLTEPDSPDDISEEHLAALSDLLGEGAVDPVLEEIDIAMRDYARQRAALRSQIELVDQRIETLRAAIANYTEASVAEEQRLSRMLEMADRGLAAADRVNDARIAALAASSRLLTVESDIFAARSERERLNVEMESLRDEHRGDLLIENRDLSREVAELSGRIEGLRALILGTAPSAETGIETSIETFIYRGSGADEEFRLVEMGDTVRPGDVIEIRMILGVLSD
jgi:chromosome segregation ATPase